MRVQYATKVLFRSMDDTSEFRGDVVVIRHGRLTALGFSGILTYQGRMVPVFTVTHQAVTQHVGQCVKAGLMQTGAVFTPSEECSLAGSVIRAALDYAGREGLI